MAPGAPSGVMIAAILGPAAAVGKTTLALHLAGEAALRHSRVLLIDADPRGAAWRWARARAERGGEELFCVTTCPPHELSGALEEAGPFHDHVIVDTAFAFDAIRPALAQLDLALVIVSPVIASIRAGASLAALATRGRRYQRRPEALLVVNRLRPGDPVNAILRDAMAASPAAMLATAITERFAFPESEASGRLVHEIDPQGPADRAIEMLLDELAEHGMCVAGKAASAMPAPRWRL
ncbi:MAG TPA: ParA family protein [Alphaproteobacteria bacterium]|nr:ParA family protein [Alphaproteobacteria bacterium]